MIGGYIIEYLPFFLGIVKYQYLISQPPVERIVLTTWQIHSCTTVQMSLFIMFIMLMVM